LVLKRKHKKIKAKIHNTKKKKTQTKIHNKKTHK
jgi:hypothetical protein